MGVSGWRRKWLRPSDHAQSYVKEQRLKDWIPCTIWITGLSASGKTTLGRGLYDYFKSRGVASVLLDGEEVRKRLDREYGYSTKERVLVVEHIGNMAEKTVRQGELAIISTISHVYSARLAVRKRLGNLFEIYLKCPPAVCAQRDTKGQYVRAMRGEVENFIGVTEPYQESPNPELVIDTSAVSAKDALAAAIKAVSSVIFGKAASRK